MSQTYATPDTLEPVQSSSTGGPTSAPASGAPATGGVPTGGAPESRTFATANDLPPGTRGPVIRRLNRALADTTDLTLQAKFAHWNVKGMDFYQLHLLFDELHETFEGHADMLAERATALGGQAMGTVRMAGAASSLPELSPNLVTGPHYLEALSAHVAHHATNLRADIEFAAGHGDEDTADLFTEISREVDQQLYFLESHLQTSATGTVSGLEAQSQAGGSQGGVQGGSGLQGGTGPTGGGTAGAGVGRTTFQAGANR